MDSISLLPQLQQDLSGGWKIVKQWVQNNKVTSFEAAETAEH
jgi:hypothetical protein